MNIPYELIDEAFLSKVTEYEFLSLPIETRTRTIDGYRSRAVSSFMRNCKYDLSKVDNESRSFCDNFDKRDVYEIVDIISEGMLVQWMKPYVYSQESLENALNTRDYQTYSPGELLMRVVNTYNGLKKDFIQKVRDYSYNHGDLGGLHL